MQWKKTHAEDNTFADMNVITSLNINLPNAMKIKGITPRGKLGIHFISCTRNPVT